MDGHAQPRDPSAPDGRRTPLGRAARYLPLIVLVVGLAGFFALGFHRQLRLETVLARQAELAAFVADHGVLAALVFVGIYAGTVALSIPGASVLTIVGGFLFGLVGASLLVVIGATLGAAAVFLATRSAFGGVLRRKAGPAARRFEAGFRRNAFSYLLSLRLIPLVPFWLVNLVSAVLDVPLRTFVLATAIGIVPGTVVYAGIGSGLGSSLEAGGIDPAMIFRPEMLLPLLGLAVLSLLPVLRLRFGRRGRNLPD